MEKVTINGETHDITFTMRTAITLQREADISAFDMTEIKGQDYIEAMLTMAAEMLGRAGLTCTVDSLLSGLETMEDTMDLVNAVSREMERFFTAKKGDIKPSSPEDEEEDVRPND